METRQTKIQTETIGLEPSKKKPLWEIKVGAFSATIWENDKEINGSTVKMKNVAFSKHFKGRDGEFRTSTIYPTENEIPKAILALQRAYEELMSSDQESE